MSTVVITLQRENAKKLLDDCPPEEFRGNFEPQHHELAEELKKALANEAG